VRSRQLGGVSWAERLWWSPTERGGVGGGGGVRTAPSVSSDPRWLHFCAISPIGPLLPPATNGHPIEALWAPTALTVAGTWQARCLNQMVF
jgi:hypothetical protein